MDKKQCRYTDENGQVQNPSLNACAEAVSAVKAIQIAASQGQKVYTVNASNASAALAASGAGGEIKEAIQAGMEVTFHERGINAHGWSGTGYSIVDPETGVGSYLIEGKGNGAIIILAGAAILFLATFIAFTGVGLIIASAIYALGFAFIAAGLAKLSGDSVLCKNILGNAAALFIGVLIGVGAVAALQFGWALALKDQVLLEMLIGLGAAVTLSEVDRTTPLFRICEN